MARTYNVGNVPPDVVWTVVRGDTAAFKVYVTDDQKLPIDLYSDWTIQMDIERNGSNVVSLTPAPDADDEVGEFTVSLTSEQSTLLETDDVFDIQLSDPARVWTVAKGKFVVIEDVTQ